MLFLFFGFLTYDHEVLVKKDFPQDPIQGLAQTKEKGHPHIRPVWMPARAIQQSAGKSIDSKRVILARKGEIRTPRKPPIIFSKTSKDYASVLKGDLRYLCFLGLFIP